MARWWRFNTLIHNDHWLREHGYNIFDPFEANHVRTVFVSTDAPLRKVISFGVTSFGYDLRLSPSDFRIFKHVPGSIVDPKKFNPANLEPARLHKDEDGSRYFILPGHSYGLGVALERMTVPDDVIIVAIGKSTYARCGVIANTTPAEPGWSGFLTLEFSNSSPTDCRIYADEGVVQLLLFHGGMCQTPYGRREGGGKYQHQKHEVTLPRT